MDLIRGETTVSLLCSFIDPNEQEEGFSKNNFIKSNLILSTFFADDIFGLDEISIYNGDWNENVYAVSGEVVDSVSIYFAYRKIKNSIFVFSVFV